MGARRARIAAATVALAAAVAAVVAIVAWSGSAPKPRHSAAPPQPTTVAPAPAPSAAPSSSAPADPRRPVAAAVPTSFVMRGPAFTIRAQVCSMPYVRPLDPPGEQHHTVCWVQHPFGVQPGYPSTGTSYLLGHAWAEDPLEVLNPMSERAMKQVNLDKPSHEAGVPIYPVTDLDGYTITLGTPSGTLVYRVDRVFAVSKQRAADVPSVMADRTPGRVVIITCGVRDGVDVDVNVIAYASLVSSTPV